VLVLLAAPLGLLWAGVWLEAGGFADWSVEELLGVVELLGEVVDWLPAEELDG